ncbi:hypothetical protein ACQJBY_073386 [Aegilops geniculata]
MATSQAARAGHPRRRGHVRLVCGDGGGGGCQEDGEPQLPSPAVLPLLLVLLLLVSVYCSLAHGSPAVGGGLGGAKEWSTARTGAASVELRCCVFWKMEEEEIVELNFLYFVLLYISFDSFV